MIAFGEMPGCLPGRVSGEVIGTIPRNRRPGPTQLRGSFGREYGRHHLDAGTDAAHELRVNRDLASWSSRDNGNVVVVIRGARAGLCGKRLQLAAPVHDHDAIAG